MGVRGWGEVDALLRRMGLIRELVVDSAVGYRVSNTAPRWIEPLRRSPLCGGGLQTASRFDSPSTFLHFLGLLFACNREVNASCGLIASIVWCLAPYFMAFTDSSLLRNFACMCAAGSMPGALASWHVVE